MQNPIKNLKIKNFKSIRDLKMDCSRINILIGKPNVGKSNILEALGLFSAPYSSNNKNCLADIIRYNDLKNLFYDNDTNNNISVESNIGNAILQIANYDRVELFLGQNIEGLVEDFLESKDSIYDRQAKLFELNKDKNLIPEFYSRYSIHGDYDENKIFNKLFYSPVKKYSFSEYKTNHSATFSNTDFLLPVGGSNLFEVLQGHSELRKQVSGYFDQYGLKLLLDFEKKSLQVQKEVDGIAYKIPFTLIADTLQRIIFHFAAIESNTDSILLFEEPENHSFPPYIKELADKIVDNQSNQYFITTHSPYLLTTIIEREEDVSVFVVTFEDYMTKTKKLSKEDLAELLDNGVDIFFNIKWFENE